MDFFETVKTRYSYRGEYTNDDIPEKDLNMILESGCLAPTGFNMQTTEMVLCKDEATKKKIGDLFEHDGMKTAPTIIVLVSSHQETSGFSFEMQDYSSVTEHICLAATALGYATVWTDGDTSHNGMNKKVASMLGVPDDKTVRAVLPIGIAKTPGEPAKKKGIKELVHFEKY